MSNYINTVHYAHLPIYSSTSTTMHQEYLRVKAVNIIVDFVLSRHNNISLDEEFRCVFLTEVGLVSDCLTSLEECIQELIDIVKTKDYLIIED